MANEIWSVVTGAVNGQFSKAFARISQIHARQPGGFAFAIIVGDLFADTDSKGEDHDEQALELLRGELTDLLEGKIEVPLPTYFSLDTRSLPSAVVQKLEANDGELCPNLSILGRKTSFRTIDGFKIAAVGGKYAEGVDAAMSLYDASFNDADAQAAGKDFAQADILVTSEWPAGVSTGSNTPYAGSAPTGVQCVSDTCSRLKPRYHFSASESSYERLPFFQPGPSPRHATRFISLAPYQDASVPGQKWICAYNLEPSAPPPIKVEGFTESPFLQPRKRKLDSQQESFNNFRYSNGNAVAHADQEWGGRGKRRRGGPPPPLTPSECFFCLSNNKKEQHMVTAVADDTYMTIAKGPLTTKTTFPQLGVPGHMLIIPLQHSPTLSLIPESEVREKTRTEMQKYRRALHEMLTSTSKDLDGNVRLGAVTWEISRSGGVHLVWQFLPIPAEFVLDGRAEAAFDANAENLEYPKFRKSFDDAGEVETGDYLKVMIWSHERSTEMVLPLSRDFRFDLQFPRKTLAMLLGLESRMDWRKCAQSGEEEEADAEAFKKIFEKFDLE